VTVGPLCIVLLVRSCLIRLVAFYVSTLSAQPDSFLYMLSRVFPIAGLFPPLPGTYKRTFPLSPILYRATDFPTLHEASDLNTQSEWYEFGELLVCRTHTFVRQTLPPRVPLPAPCRQETPGFRPYTPNPRFPNLLPVFLPVSDSLNIFPPK